MQKIRLPLDHHPAFWHFIFTLLCGGSLAFALYGYGQASSVQSALMMLAGIGSLSVLLYGYFLSPKRIILNTFFIQNKVIPPLKIAVAGDFHVGPYKGRAFVQRAVDAVLAASPDLILLPGDFLFNCLSDAAELESLNRLTAPLGVFAVMGNHDTGRYRTFGGRLYETQDRTQDLTDLLTNFGIRVLASEHVTIDVDGRPLTIAGVPDNHALNYDLPAALKNIPRDHPILLLAHSPDVILDDASHRADLIVCGHTHGGQIRLPFIGALAPIPDNVGRKYDRGIFSIGEKTTLAITSGLGESGVRARLFCPPEIMVIEVGE